MSAVLAAAAFAQGAMRPGLYEVTAEMHLPGAPAPTVFKTTECITADQLKQLPQAISAQAMSTDDCKVSNLKSTGDKLAFDVQCGTGQAATLSHTEVDFHASGYDMITTVKMEGVSTVSKAKAKWLSETCGK